jgi:uncharacterized DUF497 family protein
MIIEDLIWLPDVVEKLLRKHKVTPYEVEEIFFDLPRFRFHEKGRVLGENMYSVLGQTETGRYLIIFFLLKPGNRALIVSARDMDFSERKRYERK